MLLAVALVASPALAQDECPGKCPSQSGAVSTASTQDECPGKCPSQSAVATVSTQEDGKSCSQCPVEKAMANLPKMTYMVGKETTCCDKSAAKLAKKAEKPIHFVVGDKTYEKKDKAYVALVESTEAYVNKFTSPSKCEKSGTTSIAGTSCGCPVEAGKKAELVKTAIKDIKMTYKVGKETTCCDKSAGELVKKTGEKMAYVVAGEETCCNITARLNLAKAKYVAAVKAIAATEKKTAPAKEKAGT